MSGEIRARVEVELALLRRLIDDHSGLIDRTAQRAPEAWERSALAALLHGFYNGVENTFKMLASGRGSTPASPDWHSALLQSMARPAGASPAVIDGSLTTSLEDYMRFRHFFRHAYVFDLKWDKMKPLIDTLEEVFGRFATQVRAYVAGLV